MELPENKITDAVAVYCECGKIIYAITMESYRKPGGKKWVDHYFERGYRAGMVTSEEVRGKFGCDCKHPISKP